MARVFSKEVEMAQAKTAVAHKPIWLDLSSSDPAGSREFYSKLFGWNIDVNPDPQYGGGWGGGGRGEGRGGGGRRQGGRRPAARAPPPRRPPPPPAGPEGQAPRGRPGAEVLA